MEMPIQIFITLFVLIVVGSLVIMFSQTLIDQAGYDVKNFKAEDNGSGLNLLEVKSLDSSQVAALVEQCNSENYGQSLNTKTCYIVRSDTAFNIARSDVVSRLSSQDILSEDFEAQGKTIFIEWDSLQGKVVVNT